MCSGEAAPFSEVADLLEAHAPPGSFAGPATDAEVAQASRELGVRLPDSYVLYLRRFGSGWWPEAVYGVGRAVVRGRSVVGMAERERRHVEPEMPAHLVPFSPDGWGNHFCLDTSVMRSGECPVVCWNHELPADQTPELVAPSFGAWLERAVAERVGP